MTIRNYEVMANGTKVATGNDLYDVARTLLSHHVGKDEQWTINEHIYEGDSHSINENVHTNLIDNVKYIHAFILNDQRKQSVCSTIYDFIINEFVIGYCQDNSKLLKKYKFIMPLYKYHEDIINRCENIYVKKCGWSYFYLIPTKEDAVMIRLMLSGTTDVCYFYEL